MRKLKSLLPVTVAALIFTVAFTPADAESDQTSSGPRDGKANTWTGGVLSGMLAEREDSPASESADDVGRAAVSCADGFAGPYPCKNVDLLAHVPLAQLGGAPGSDLWGWTDPQTGQEIAIMGTGLGTTFVDVTEPTTPIVLGHLPTATVDRGSRWRDIKVDQDHAFIVSENGELQVNGMQVFDLTRLRDAVAHQPLTPDATYTEFRSAHNLVINTDTHFAYAVGSNTCRGGLHMIDISKPTSPTFAGCYDLAYVHDAQCVVYHGPDPDYNGTVDGTPHELCFTAEESQFAVIDVTDKSDPYQINWGWYRTYEYVHQGWLTPDHRWFVVNDEMDEGVDVDNTTTYIFNVEELDRLYFGEELSIYTHSTEAIDHNLYIRDDLIYQANYTAGLRVLRYTDDQLATGDLEEIAYFDVHPSHDMREYVGAWSVYPYFESGTVVVSTIDQGMFILEVDHPEIETESS